LEVDPCIPADWKGFSVSRKFRGATYKIEVKNTGVMKGVKKLVVNGKEVAGNIIPMQPAGSVNTVEVIMG
jgi:cellobiose phosphorylase